ncbi:phosphate acyltransferase PlsX [Kingella negevensis]|uniref:phosphate acyltransferase PlsX n=1 Tax=Kingella negevensis TaxID=1522312 RepID=UPI00050A02A9|nr:phosphate acyltransferase PlsX [Kingella negevensis]MDK4679217.1 phosphate acyltransferase PlsX [Kingella negevensis]MDK4683061.1 phosphate acyltransferase PlsX [Kingella negevensis]MDK4688489.1 phosphate acyltransferase PlsX [Kingella negevensis]MDK4691261.1 phosphate acyltransferase PlsX [Kingella negevensis]MDK4693591.1 phosphate acyltransferase PlsX [Kingella negevensis]
MITLSVDAMGGDEGLTVTAPAVARFLQNQADVRLIMVGDSAQIQAALAKENVPMERVEIVHASEVVGMDESPQHALKNKKDSSMRVAIQQVKEGKAQAAVSAGNTGALMATARFVLKTLAGIDRPAIAKFMPAAKGHQTLVLDLGANVDCTPEQLLQFAVMGGQLVRALQPENANPKIGLLNIGTEDIKGTETVKQTFTLLRESNLNFIGNVEANTIFDTEADVIVADGFTGNVVLKTVEGTIRFAGGMIKQEFTRNVFTKLSALAALPVLKSFKRRLDPRRYNGAIFLGLHGVVVKSHGGTDKIGFMYALEEAYHEAQANSIAKIEQGIAAQLNKSE